MDVPLQTYYFDDVVLMKALWASYEVELVEELSAHIFSDFRFGKELR